MPDKTVSCSFQTKGVSMHFIRFVRPVVTIGLLFILQNLYSQKIIKVVDKDNNPVSFAEALDVRSDSLLYRATYNGIITIRDTGLSTIKITAPNFVERVIAINEIPANDTIILEQKTKRLNDVIVTTSAHPDLVITAYVRDYRKINDSLTGYLDAVVDYVIPENYKKSSVKPLLKQYRIYSRKITPQKKRWIEISEADAGIPKLSIESVLNTQAYSVLVNNTIVPKKYPDSVAGTISFKDSLLEIQIDRSIAGDKAVHNLLGYRIQSLNKITEEIYRCYDNNFFATIADINNLASKHYHIKFLLKHKKDEYFNVEEMFSDIIILNAKYMEHSKATSIPSIKFIRDKSSYQTHFWKNYMNTLPKDVEKILENLN